MEPDAISYLIARAELDNWRAALQWALTNRNDVILGQRIVGELYALWAPFLRDGMRWLPAALESVHEQTPDDVLAKLQFAHTYLTGAVRDYETSLAVSAPAITLCERVGDLLGKAYAQTCAGRALLEFGRLAEAEPLFQNALAIRSLGNRKLVSVILRHLAGCAVLGGDFATARTYWADALQCARMLGHDEEAMWCIVGFGMIERFSGNFDAALSYARDALAEFCSFELRAPGAIALTLSDVATCLICLGRYDQAEEPSREALIVAHEFHLILHLGIKVRNFAMIGAFSRHTSEGIERRSRVTSARIVGFVKTQLATTRTTWTWLDCPERREYDRAQTVLREELGGDAFAKHIAEGGAMTQDEIVKEALSL
jgi:tetratricopeptide (TPR) repeat protein